LIKREKGAVKVIAQDSVPYISGKSYIFEVIAQGSALKVNIDGKPVFSVTDQTFKGGSVALYSSHNAGSIFDDILVEEIPTKAVLLWDNFNDGNFKGWLVFDEDASKEGPSAWSVRDGELVQNSNIGANNRGTFVLY
jgi:fructan beta-fructosidase